MPLTSATNQWPANRGDGTEPVQRTFIAAMYNKRGEFNSRLNWKDLLMKNLFAAALIATTMGGFGAANAMPLAPATSTNPDVIQVAGGCGPGFHRGPYGGCRRNAGAVVVAPARGVVVVRPGARRCPPGMFMSRYGCRRR